MVGWMMGMGVLCQAPESCWGEREGKREGQGEERR